MSDVKQAIPEELFGELGTNLDSRPSFMDAVANLCENGHLARLLREDNIIDWTGAANADLADARTLFAHLAEDLTAITGVKCLPPMFHDVLDTVAFQSYDSVKDRVAGMRDGLVKALQEIVKTTLMRLRRDYIRDDTSRVVGTDWSQSRRRNYDVYAKTIYPLTPLTVLKDVATFTFPHGAGNDRKVYEFGLATPALVSPDDHNMSIPLRTQKKLDVLKTTHFNYHPKILRGVPVRKKAVEMEKKVFMPEFRPDPALVVHLGWQIPFVCDYWEDPAANEDAGDVQPGDDGSRRAWKMDCISNMAIAGPFLVVGIIMLASFDWSSWRLWGDVLATILGFVLAGIGGCGILDTVSKLMSGPLPKIPPVQTHVMQL